MAEYSSNALQTLPPNTALPFTETPGPCTRGLIFHRDGTGLFKLASPSRITGRFFYGCPCTRHMLEAVYTVSFHANIGVPEGGTIPTAPEGISLAIAIDGVVDPSSTMISTPTVVETLDNVGAEIQVYVPAICGCEDVAVINTSTIPIAVQNANLIIAYSGIR